jgi:hypothetical protein
VDLFNEACVSLSEVFCFRSDFITRRVFLKRLRLFEEPCNELDFMDMSVTWESLLI